MEDKATGAIFISQLESFYEIKISSPSPLAAERVFAPKTSIVQKLKDHKEHFSTSKQIKVFLTTKLVNKILKRRIGTQPAHLVTAGFEHWLDLNIPIKEDFFTVGPSKVQSPVNRELTFGINERVDSTGKQLKAIDLAELEFLASKLKLNEVKSIAVTFMHSQSNTENEKTVGEYFTQQGFKIFSTLSYQSANAKGERQRWLRAVLNAYLYPTFFDTLASLQKDLEAALELPVELLVGNNKGEFENFKDIEPLNSLFAFEKFMINQHRNSLANKNSVNKQGLFCHFGIEEFTVFDPETSHKNIWQSEFGEVLIEHESASFTSIQPTTLLEKGSNECPSFSEQQIGYEPGPMCFGRSTSPTLLDLLYVGQVLNKSSSITPLLVEKTLARIKESVMAYSKGERKANELSLFDTIEGTLNIALNCLASSLNCNDKNFIYIAGSLREVGAKLINRLPKKKVLFLENEFLPVESLYQDNAL